MRGAPGFLPSRAPARRASLGRSTPRRARPRDSEPRLQRRERACEGHNGAGQRARPQSPAAAATRTRARPPPRRARPQLGASLHRDLDAMPAMSAVVVLLAVTSCGLQAHGDARQPRSLLFVEHVNRLQPVHRAFSPAAKLSQTMPIPLSKCPQSIAPSGRNVSPKHTSCDLQSQRDMLC